MNGIDIIMNGSKKPIHSAHQMAHQPTIPPTTKEDKYIRFIETPEELQPTQKCGNNFTHIPNNQPMRYKECISC